MQFHRDPKDRPFFKIPPEPLYIYKHVAPFDKINLPELPENRKLTDFPFFVIFGLMFLTWVALSIYIGCTSSGNGDLRGEDSCGNICGKNNMQAKNKSCDPKDYTDYPISLYKVQETKFIPVTCIKAENCTKKMKRNLHFGRCFPVIPFRQRHYMKLHLKIRNFIVFDVLFKGRLPILGIIAFSIGASLLMITAFRYHIRFTLIASTIFAIMEFVLSTARIWYIYVAFRDLRLWAFYGVLLTALMALLLYTCLKLAQRFQLIIALYQEAIKAIFDMPFLIALPLLTIVFLFVICGLTFYLLMLIMTDNHELSEKQQEVRTIYYVVLGVMLIWMYSFVNGCQCTVVAGAVASYFFEKFKFELKQPVQRSMKILVRYHLGTIAAGSLIVTILRIINVIVHIVREKMKRSRSVIFLCIGILIIIIFGALEEIAEYLTKKAYIMTAIHGQGLCKSGKRAARLLWYFLLDSVVMDGLVYTVVHSLSIAIIVTALLICLGIVWAAHLEFYKIYFLLVGACLSFTIVYFYTAMINISAETMFLCFCEDRFLNDGSPSRPYFMPKSFSDLLMSSAEQVQKDIEKREQERDGKPKTTPTESTSEK